MAKFFESAEDVLEFMNVLNNYTPWLEKINRKKAALATAEQNLQEAQERYDEAKSNLDYSIQALHDRFVIES